MIIDSIIINKEEFKNIPILEVKEILKNKDVKTLSIDGISLFMFFHVLSTIKN